MYLSRRESLQLSTKAGQLHKHKFVNPMGFDQNAVRLHGRVKDVFNFILVFINT